MKTKEIIISTVESIYIFYMYNLFKTKYSFHHPFEYLVNSFNIDFIKHPIYSGKYESKICNFGKLVSIFLIFWIWLRYYLNKFLKRKVIILMNRILFINVLIFSLIMNINSFIYFIPVYIYELLFFN